MNEHGWMKAPVDPMVDENYMLSREYGVRIRKYEDGEQPGILEVLSPQLHPLPTSRTHSQTLSHTQSQTASRTHSGQSASRARESSQSSSRAPKIFTAIAEQAQAEQEERERLNMEMNGHRAAPNGYHNGYGYPDSHGNESGSGEYTNGDRNSGNGNYRNRTAYPV